MLYCHLIVIVNAISVVQRRTDRSSHRTFSIKKGVLTNFSKSTGKHLCQSLFFKRLYYRFFSANFPKFVGPLFIIKHLWGTASAFRIMSNIYYRTFLWKQQVVTVFQKKNHQVSFRGFQPRIVLAVSFSCIANKITWRYSSSRSEMFLKVGVLKNVANFTGKQLR